MKRVAVAAAVLLIVVAAAVAGVALYVRHLVRAPFRGYDTPEVFVQVPPGTTARDIGRRLVQAGVVADPTTFRAAVWLSGEGPNLRAGEYRFTDAMTPLEVVGKVARGEVYTIPITFPEGLTIPKMAEVFEARGLGPAAAFADAARDASLVAAFDPDAPDLEGYLFPETYQVPRDVAAPVLVRAMVRRFEQVLTPALRAAAAARGLSVRQLVTLASLVERETARADERAIVAAVYANRLARGMPLQCDPTVIYALERAGAYTGNLRRVDLDLDSPYNTYRVAGLPPGPIAAPGQASLEAAAHPADVDYLYFVSRNDGSHAFARTLAEHNRNVQRYQVEYFKARRGR